MIAPITSTAGNAASNTSANNTASGTVSNAAGHTANSTILVRDRYTDELRLGRVIGSRSPDGAIRRGIDTEGVIGIDNGALRIRPLIQSGWQRCGLAYGPFERADGLAFATYIVNGHNTSQFEPFPDTLVQRAWRWARGPGVHPVPQRMLRLFSTFHAKTLVRRWHSWLHNFAYAKRLPEVLENLAVGWFASEAPTDPVNEGNAFVVRAGGPVNGILHLHAAEELAPAILSLQNVPIYYITILRERGAAYYVASLPFANGMAAYPSMRPLGIDAFQDEPTVYAAVHQSVIGQIGFKADTRIYGSCVAELPEVAHWYGTAHAADSLEGNKLLDRSPAEIGGLWSMPSGRIERTARGATAAAANSLAILTPEAASGLIHALVSAPDAADACAADNCVALVWRYADRSNYWQFTCSSSGCRLALYEEGQEQALAVSDNWRLQAGRVNALQVLDNGESFGLYLNGHLVFDQMFANAKHQSATGVGFYLPAMQPSLLVQRFEAHPRTVPMPAELQFGAPWLQLGEQVVVQDRFAGAAGELAGTSTATGGKRWRKAVGDGQFEVTGTGGAKVNATVQNPCPGRTAYTVDWDHPEFADLEVTITPPGTSRNQGERGRGGFIFWQDEKNYITFTCWLDDSYPGAAFAAFFYFDGYEELYDAVWSNVGQRIDWGVSSTLRVVFDGLKFLTFINDEPVLYRALTDVYPKLDRIKINQVGIVANWEWGTDTGSLFQNFVAKV